MTQPIASPVQEDKETSHKDYAVFSGNKQFVPDVPEVTRDNQFIWTLTEEPHFSRRKEILKKYPEIQSLFGVDTRSKFVIAALVILQLACAFTFRSMNSYKSPLFWLCAYVIGGTVNQALFLAIHEMSHNLAFKSIKANKLYSILVANVPIGFPYAASFKPYHMDHHKYQGIVGVDTDLPTRLEALLFKTIVGKFLFASFQVLFYAIRPIFVKYQVPTWYTLLNVVYQIIFDAALVVAFGPGAFVYLVASTLFAGSGLHPCASHFIAEHYVFSGDWETYSYYGWLNMFCFNVGYHNEHHDFPNIPGSRLPQLRAIASEYYDHLPYHESWPLVTWKFITDPNVTVFNRVKRLSKGVSKKID